MDIQNVVDGIQSLSDEELYNLLDACSEEMKRRNQLKGPSIGSIRSNSVGENVNLVLEALGVRPKPSGV